MSFMDRKTKVEKRKRRRNRIRAKVQGSAKRPRLSVFRSNKYLSAQVIDDEKGQTLFSESSVKAKGKNNMEKAKTVGLELPKKAKSKKIEEVVFDRGGYIYTGKIKALAEGAREGGLKF